MRRTTYTALALALAASALQAQAPKEKDFAPTIKTSGLLQVWYSQMLDSNLRLNLSGTPYYSPRADFKENTFAIRRAEIKFSGEIVKGVKWSLMIDPVNQPGSPLQDLDLTYDFGNGLELSVGQYKINSQTLEGLTSSADLMFAERSQIGARIGDKRDRGAKLAYAFGDPKGFRGKTSFIVANGNTEVSSGKANDLNAGKDYAFRLEFWQGQAHNFGFYTLQGSTDVKDSDPGFRALTFTGGPSAQGVLDNRDKTSNLGAFYAYREGPWRLEAELITGVLGRRYASVGTTASPAKREHLDQKFLSYVLSGSYVTGKHTFGLRYDFSNWNSGDQWYGATNPYKNANRDYTPAFTEITAGYTYALDPAKPRAANIKLNYINRSKNFLLPRAGQTGEQGGDTLLAAFQVAF